MDGCCNVRVNLHNTELSWPPWVLGFHTSQMRERASAFFSSALLTNGNGSGDLLFSFLGKFCVVTAVLKFPNGGNSCSPGPFQFVEMVGVGMKPQFYAYCSCSCNQNTAPVHGRHRTPGIGLWQP